MWFFHKTSVLLNLEKHLPAAKDFIKKYLEIPHASNVKYSLRSDYQAIELRNKYLEWEKRQRTNKTFSSIVMSHLERKGMRPSAFYHKAGIDRKLFSKMKTDFCYQPNKLTALRCCLALQLSKSESHDLLESAGFSFSTSSSFDLAIFYCITNGIYDLYAVNTLLDALGEKVFV